MIYTSRYFPPESEPTYKIKVIETDTNETEIVYKDLELDIAELRFTQVVKDCNLNRRNGECGECKIQMLDSSDEVINEDMA